MDPGDVAPGDTLTCTATATDAHGGSDSAAASLSLGNSDPSFTSDAVISPASGVTTSTVLACSASAWDPDGGTPAISYAWTSGGTALGTGASLALDPGTVQPGATVTCTATASDSAGGSATSSDSVVVVNTDPVVDSVAIAPSAGVTTGTTLTCSASAWDADEGALSLTYAWSDGSTGATLALTPTTASPGDTVTCTVTATDADGGAASASASVTVQNTTPTVSAAISPPSGVLIGDTLTCTASASDPDGGTPTLAYAWTSGSAALGTAPTWTVSAADVSPGDTVTCTVTATDADGGAASASASVTITNRTPSVSGVAISPDPAHATDALTCAYTYSDPDGDPDRSTVAWTVAGAPAGTGLTLSSGFGSGDVVACTVTPFDGYSSGTPASDSLTIANTAPRATSVAISPTSPVTTDTLSAAVTGWYDADGDAEGYLYEWYVAGTLRSTAATLDPSYTTKGRAVFVKVTPWDGIDSGTQLVSSSVTIQNSAPTAPGLAIGPSGAAEGDSLTCTIATPSTDADGDAVTCSYAWYRDGAVVSGATGTSLAGSYVVAGSAYHCAVTASDGSASTTGTSPALTPCALLTWYVDGDGDGYGDPAGTTEACTVPAGYAGNDDDCDDSDPAVSPGASETCDGIDNDCDGVVDFSDEDIDLDGYTTCDGDCDDSDPYVHPAMIEVCGNGLDDDCDGVTDAADVDGDGYDGCGVEDCDDYAELVYPGAPEIPDDRLDNDCDGVVDAADSDDDGDGYAEDDGDCDDAAPWISPAATEIPDTDVDEDCNTAEEYALDWSSSAIFADASLGSDYFPGTQRYPVATLTRAVALATAAGKPVVAVAGTYREDLSTSVDVFGGYAGDWSAVTGTSVLVGDLTFAGAARGAVVSALTVEGAVAASGDGVFYGGEVWADSSVAWAVDATAGSLGIARSLLVGPGAYTRGDIATVRFGAEGGWVWDSTVVSGIGGDGSDGANASGTTSEAPHTSSGYGSGCGFTGMSSAVVGTGNAGSDGGSAPSVVGVEVVDGGAATVAGSLVLGGFAGVGGDGGDGADGSHGSFYNWSSGRSYDLYGGGGAAGDGGDGGQIVLIQATEGELALVGSLLSGGSLATGGSAGVAGDASGWDCISCCWTWSCLADIGGYGGDGGDAGDPSTWHGALGNVSAWGSTIGGPFALVGSTPTASGAGAGTSCCSGYYCMMYVCYGDSTAGTGASPGDPWLAGLEIDESGFTPAADPTLLGNRVLIQSAEVGGGWPGPVSGVPFDADVAGISTTGGTVSRNVVSLGSTASAWGVAASDTVTVASNLVEILGTGDSVGIDLSGEDALAVSNTVVLDGAGTGLWTSGGHMVGLVDNLVQTGTGGTCLEDGTSSRDYLLDNLVWGCTNRLYHDSSGYRTRAAELDFVTVTTAAGGHVYADPAFTDAAASDYTLRASSPAVDAGYDVSSATFGAVSWDVVGAMCPAGGGYDIGAFER